jgi:hypothetical protein
MPFKLITAFLPCTGQPFNYGNPKYWPLYPEPVPFAVFPLPANGRACTHRFGTNPLTTRECQSRAQGLPIVN